MMRREKEEEKGKGFMEWDWKSPSWDFAELERETKSNIITPIIRSSSLGGGKQTSHEDFSFDLKLGRLEEIGGSGQMTQWKDPRVTITPSPLSSSKKARAPSYETQTVSCLVEGCDSDLSKYRDYYRRHKVCEDHSKTPKVMVAGQEQRFCQQCSRFHLLSEFDEVKRSCRKRLDGHNRRRRKSQSDSFSMNSGGLFSNLQGTKYLSFSSPQLFQSSNLIDGQNQFPGSVSSNFNEGKQSLFMNINDPGRGFQKGAHEVSFCQPLFNTVASSSRNSEASRKMFADRFSNGVGLDSDSALSLLSSAPNCQRSEISPGNHSYIVHPNSIPVGRPIEGGIVAEGLPYAALVAPADSGLHISHTGLTEQQQQQLPYQGSILYTGLDGSLGHGPAQTFPFTWE